MTDYLFLLIPLLLAGAWLLTLMPTNRRAEGAVIVVRPIPALARMKRHAVPHGLVAAVTVVLVLSGNASAWWVVALIASFLAVSAIPQTYIVTTRGICTGRGGFRRWTEFAGVYRSAAGVTLQTIGRNPNVPIWLAGDRGDDEFVHLLRTLVRDSYKGKLAALPVVQAAERGTGEVPELGGIAAFQKSPPMG